MNINKHSPKVLAALAGLASFSYTAQAQELFGAYSDYQQRAGAELSQDSLLQSDGFDRLKVGVRAGVKYDSNIFLESASEESDVIFTTDLILGLESEKNVQDHWALTYVASYRSYVSNSNLNGLNNSLHGAYGKTFSKTQVDLSASVNDVSGSDRFNSGHTDKLFTAFNLDVSRVLTGKTRLDFDLGFRGADYDDDSTYNDRQTYNTRVALQYQWTGKTTIGPYVGYEYVDVADGANANAVSGGLSVNYQAFAKTALSGSFGLENRSFSGDAIGDRTSGIWDLGVTHNYTTKTSFGAHLYGKSQPSASRDGVGYESTGVNLNAKHVVSSRLNLRARAGFEHDNYFRVNDTSVASRSDNDYYFLSVGGQYRAAHGIVIDSDVSWRTQNADNSNQDFDDFTLQLSASYYF